MRKHPRGAPGPALYQAGRIFVWRPGPGPGTMSGGGKRGGAVIRFGRIFDQVTDADLRKMAEVQAIFRKAFPDAAEEAARFPELLDHRHELGYKVVLLTAEEEGEQVIGFALAH